MRDVIAEGRTVTYDLGGTAGTRAFADAVIERLGERSRRRERRPQPPAHDRRPTTTPPASRDARVRARPAARIESPRRPPRLISARPRDEVAQPTWP